MCVGMCGGGLCVWEDTTGAQEGVKMGNVMHALLSLNTQLLARCVEVMIPTPSCCGRSQDITHCTKHHVVFHGNHAESCDLA